MAAWQQSTRLATFKTDCRNLPLKDRKSRGSRRGITTLVIVPFLTKRLKKFLLLRRNRSAKMAYRIKNLMKLFRQ